MFITMFFVKQMEYHPHATVFDKAFTLDTSLLVWLEPPSALVTRSCNFLLLHHVRPDNAVSSAYTRSPGRTHHISDMDHQICSVLPRRTDRGVVPTVNSTSSGIFARAATSRTHSVHDDIFGPALLTVARSASRSPIKGVTHGTSGPSITTLLFRSFPSRRELSSYI
jgi:hypothetical protein